MKGHNDRSLLPTFKSWIDDFWGAENLYSEDFLGLRKMWAPAVNIKNNKGSFDIELAAPGLTKDDFEVRIENGMLCISAEKEDTKDVKEDKYTRREFNFSTFERKFTLPENVDEKSIAAKYENGVLKLNLKKMVEDKPKAKKIAIS